MSTTFQQYFYRNGQLHQRVPMKNGRMHGRARTWHRNGQMAAEFSYWNGKLHGVNRQWDEYGRLLGIFRMNQGTGTQRSWHDNGQPKFEMGLLNGKFHGRLRIWLQDGTLVKETFHIHGPKVSRGAYLKAARRNPDWPQYEGQLAGKIARSTVTLKQREYKLFIHSIFEKPHAEARQWLSGETKKQHRSLPIFRTAQAALRFVEQLYAAGAETVEVAPLYAGSDGKLFADWLLIQLPKIQSGRRALRKLCDAFCHKRDAAMLPDKDIAESHLFLRLH
jgi:hypothetical protein